MADKKDERTVSRVLQMTEQGFSPRHVAAKCKLSTSQVQYLLHTYGRDRHGKLHQNPEQKRKHTHPLPSAIKVHGCLTIEEGLNGGYIATVGDVWMGGEAATWMEAINLAMAASEGIGV